MRPWPLLFLTLALVNPGMSHAAESLVQDGDRWVCLGDSITAQDIYRRMLARAFAHYHPDATLTVINSGQGGDTASDDPQKLANRVLKHKPTIVSIMYGMNEAINAWHRGQPKEPVQARYRAGLTYMARTLKAQGVTVLLMSPTLTDPACGWSYFTLDGSVEFLHECATIMRQVAQQEGVFYVPVQEELEAFQQTLPSGTILRSDGVHVSALGQYQMARSLWELCGFAAPLGKGTRALSQPPSPVPVALALSSRFLRPEATAIELALHTDAPVTVSANWSLGDRSGQETLVLKAGDTPWSLAIPADHLPTRNGQNTDLLVALQSGEKRSLHIIDFCRTQLLHLTNGRVGGTVESDSDRPEGRRMANWELELAGQSLFFRGDVFDAEINSNYSWPFGRDGFNLMFDFRPLARFADIGVDREVHQTLLNVYEKPFFAVGLRAWSGEGMGYAGTAAGERTPTGYRCQLAIGNDFNLYSPVKAGDRDFVGILVAVNDLDTNPANPKATTLAIVANQKNDYGVNLYANNLMVLDLKNRFPGDAIINAHIFPPPCP